MNVQRRRGQGIVLVAIVGALTASACGGSGSGSAASGGDGGGGGGGTPSASASASAAPVAAGGKSKLPGTREFGLTDEQFNSHVEKTQALIATCMREAGFEYIPVDVKSIEAAQKRVRLDPAFPRVEYKKRWGYGETTRFDDPVRDIGLGPNLQIWQRLPKADQEAYARTLWGDHPEWDFAFALDEEDFSETGGCTRQAVTKVFTPQQVKGTYVNPKDVLVDSDRRIVAANKKWSDCMRGKGYDYLEDQDEIIDDFRERLDELTGGDDPRTLTGERAAALKKLQAEEIAAALADVDCEIKYTDKIYDEVETEVFGQPVP